MVEDDADIDKIWKNGFYKSTLLINTFIFIVLPVYAIYLFKQILQEDQSLTQNVFLLTIIKSYYFRMKYKRSQARSLIYLGLGKLLCLTKIMRNRYQIELFISY